MKESSIERKFTLAIKRLGGRAVKFVSPGRAGMPDRIVLLPGGLVRFVELKRPGAVPTDLQLVRHAELRELGFEVTVIDSPEAVDRYVKELMLS